jgi:hypothetical protein
MNLSEVTLPRAGFSRKTSEKHGLKAAVWNSHQNLRFISSNDKSPFQLRHMDT